MSKGAGNFDRRIQVQAATMTRDRSGDSIPTWADAFKRWAEKTDNRGFETQGSQELVRTGDTVWILRSDTESRAIAPEKHRFVYDGRIYEIIAIQESKNTRGDRLEFLTTTRPDAGGARGKGQTNGP